jgi:hypothetical protein
VPESAPLPSRNPFSNVPRWLKAERPPQRDGALSRDRADRLARWQPKNCGFWRAYIGTRCAPWLVRPPPRNGAPPITKEPPSESTAVMKNLSAQSLAKLLSSGLRLLPVLACATASAACSAEAADTNDDVQQDDVVADALSAPPDGNIAVLSVSKDNGNQRNRYARIEAQLALSNLAYEKKVAATFTCLEGSAKGKVLKSASASYKRSLSNDKEEWTAALDGVGGDSSWVIPACNRFGVQATVTMAQKQSVSKTFSFDSAAEQPRISIISSKFDPGSQSYYASRYPNVVFSMSVYNVSFVKTVDVDLICLKNGVEIDRTTLNGGKFWQSLGNNREEWAVSLVAVGGNPVDLINKCDALVAKPVLTANGQVSRGASETISLKRP